jgi:hypothetical protein
VGLDRHRAGGGSKLGEQSTLVGMSEPVAESLLADLDRGIWMFVRK